HPAAGADRARVPATRDRQRQRREVPRQRASVAGVTRAPHCTTRTGVNRSVVVPSPSWPSTLRPQQKAVPAAVTPQVWTAPAVTAAQPPPARASTRTGLDRLVVAPSPSWPKPLRPQQ